MLNLVKCMPRVKIPPINISFRLFQAPGFKLRSVPCGKTYSYPSWGKTKQKSRTPIAYAKAYKKRKAYDPASKDRYSKDLQPKEPRVKFNINEPRKGPRNLSFNFCFKESFAREHIDNVFKPPNRGFHSQNEEYSLQRCPKLENSGCIDPSLKVPRKNKGKPCKRDFIELPRTAGPCRDKAMLPKFDPWTVRRTGFWTQPTFPKFDPHDTVRDTCADLTLCRDRKDEELKVRGRIDMKDRKEVICSLLERLQKESEEKLAKMESDPKTFCKPNACIPPKKRKNKLCMLTVSRTPCPPKPKSKAQRPPCKLDPPVEIDPCRRSDSC